MYEDCLDSITTKIDSVNLFDFITGELVTSFKPLALTVTDTTYPNPTVDYPRPIYSYENGCIKFNNKKELFFA